MVLGSIFQDQEKLDEAEPLFRRSFEGREKALGAEHEDTQESMFSLGDLLSCQGNLDEAEVLCRRCLEVRESVLGGDEGDNTLVLINNLASVLDKQGKFHEAELLLKRALEGREKVLTQQALSFDLKTEVGMEHENLLTMKENLGYLLQEQERLDEAEPVFRHVLKVREKVLGDEHEYTLISKLSRLSFVLHHLADLLQDLGKVEKIVQKRTILLDEAEVLRRRELDGSEKVEGAEHPNTLHILNNLGMLLKAQGKLDEAEPYYWRALEVRERVLGAENSDTLESINKLGNLLENQGKMDQAVSIFRRALKMSEIVIGPEHEDTLELINNLALLLPHSPKLFDLPPCLIQ